MAKTIQMILFNNELAGSKMATMDKYVCHNITRNDVDLIKELSEDLSRPALYVLLSKKDRKAYIGQTDDFLQRIAQHLAKKNFWTEFFAFTANDNSLTTTEVKYLEALAYETADNANNYDLSENTQKPTKPHATSIQKINIKEFFEQSKTLSSLLGCDVFETPKVKISYAVNDESLIEPEEPQNFTIDPNELEGRCKISLNGKGPFSKNKFAHALVKEYLESFPDTTFAKLKKKFPNSLLGGWNRWPLIQDDIDKAIHYKDYGEPKKRHLIEESYRLKSADGICFVVCTEWDKTNIVNLLTIVLRLGWKYNVVRDEKK